MEMKKITKKKITKQEFLRKFADVDGDFIELNDNALQERITKKINNRAQEEMAQELERLQQLDPSRKLTIRVHE